MPRRAAAPPPRPAPSDPAAEPLDPPAGVACFLDALDSGTDWYLSLLAVIARWTAPDETVGGVTYRYLLAGEAFDWLRLAARLLAAAAARVPPAEAERLLFHGEPPDGSDEDAFARAIGPAKHRAHLNFQYGVVVEEALLLTAEQELHKARTVDGPRAEPPDVLAYERIYGQPLAVLLQLFRAETGCALTERIRYDDWQAFTYWCSKYRFRTGEPARVASDTRKALALLSRLRADHRATLPFPPPPDVIDARAFASEE
ncbi:MAG: hypothetical protein FJ035_03040 [Chloroflexi bacterium]|nr:hypothetical protein [Chloroflexota bacterium]